MRRMLDPTKLGGGDVLYCHNVVLTDANRSYISFNVYRKTQEEFKITTFKEYIKDKHIACSGIVKYNDKWTPTNLVWEFMGSIYCQSLNLTDGIRNSVSFNISKLDDHVMPVD